MRRDAVRFPAGVTAALVLALALASPSPCRAQKQVMAPGHGYGAMEAPPGDISWDSLLRMSKIRKQRAAILLPLGAITAGIGLALLGSEFTHGDTRSGSDSTLLESCTLQLRLATFLTMEGAHALVTGIAYLGRGVHLSQLANVRRVEGPSAMWGGWYEEGKKLRLVGNVLMHMGSIALSGGVSYMAPYPTCEKLYCGQCGVSDHTLQTQRTAGITLSAIGGGVLLVGAIVAAVGYARQFKLVKFRHSTRQASVQFTVGAGGPVLTW